jgi:hypothetical protein
MEGNFMIESVFTNWEIEELWKVICVPSPSSSYHKEGRNQEGVSNDSIDALQKGDNRDEKIALY